MPWYAMLGVQGAAMLLGAAVAATLRWWSGAGGSYTFESSLAVSGLLLLTGYGYIARIQRRIDEIEGDSL